MKRNSDESGPTSFKKKFRFTSLGQLAPFPVNAIPSETNLTSTCTGYFTGLSVEIFDPLTIQQIYQNGCYGKGSMSRSAPKSCNSTSSMETISRQQHQRRQIWREKFFPDRSSRGEVLIGTHGVGECVDNLFPVPETLVLFLEEAFFLHDNLKFLEIRNLDDEPMTTDVILSRFCELSPNFLKNFAAYLYLKKKNWVIKSGIKFGGDFRNIL
jgi:tRNA intron endonuclease, catalytic C-terminal domain/tRNA intron endonuclease, N-terminal domain